MGRGPPNEDEIQFTKIWVYYAVYHVQIICENNFFVYVSVHRNTIQQRCTSTKKYEHTSRRRQHSDPINDTRQDPHRG